MPDGLDLVTAAAVPLNSLAAAQLVDLLGHGEGRRLLVTGAAGAVGGYVVTLAQDRGWQVTGLARAEDEEFVRRLGADFTTEAGSGWDAVADGGVLQEQGVALVRDGGLFVGVQPSAAPAEERGVTVRVVVSHPDGARLAQLLEATASGDLPARVHAVATARRRRRRSPRGRQGRRARAVRPSALSPTSLQQARAHGIDERRRRLRCPRRRRRGAPRISPSPCRSATRLRTSSAAARSAATSASSRPVVTISETPRAPEPRRHADVDAVDAELRPSSRAAIGSTTCSSRRIARTISSTAALGAQ